MAGKNRSEKYFKHENINSESLSPLQARLEFNKNNEEEDDSSERARQNNKIKSLSRYNKHPQQAKKDSVEKMKKSGNKISSKDYKK